MPFHSLDAIFSTFFCLNIDQYLHAVQYLNVCTRERERVCACVCEYHLKHRRYDACWCLLAISISAKHIAGMSFYLWNAFYFWLLLSWIHTHTHKFPPRTLLFPLIHLAQEREKTEYASMAFKYFFSIVKCDAFTVECTQRIKTLYREIDSSYTYIAARIKYHHCFQSV